MPLYVYECIECKKTCEKLLPTTALRELPCECGSTMKKMIQTTGIKFNGSGFYETDYKNKKKPLVDKD